MSGSAENFTRQDPRRDPWWLKWSLIGFVVAFMSVFIIIPVGNIFVQAFANGWQRYLSTFFASGESTQIQEVQFNLNAIGMSLFLMAVVVPLNTIFGVAVAWLVTRFKFRGKAALLTLIDMPFAVSPVVAGMLFVILFGAQGYIAQALAWAHEQTWAQAGSGQYAVWYLNWLNGQIIFNWPGVVLATAFVTLPFVARELIPVLESQGSQEEQAAITLGASGWQMFFRITLINMKWGLLYGMVLCNARVLGEFGAVNVVSGNVRGQNTTIPLRIHQLWEDFSLTSAFALSTILVVVALITLVAKVILERVSDGTVGSRVRH
ncbi:MAG: ABC transporter permease subunit [Phycisphaerae bacterium]